MVSAREKTFFCRPEQALSALHLLVCWAQHLSLQSLHWSTGHTAPTARGSCCCLFWLEILQPRRLERSHVSIVRAAAIPLINRQGVSSQGTRPRAGTGGRAGYKYFASCKSRVAGKHESVSLLNLAHLSGTTFPRCRPHRTATVLRPCAPRSFSLFSLGHQLRIQKPIRIAVSLGQASGSKWFQVCRQHGVYTLV